jgi:Lrp/AsnC family leucine-responsive transcriptional regulator
MRNDTLDEIDRKILGILEVDGRISFRDLGLVVNLSSNATAERVERMRQRGVITGFSARISTDALGLPLHAFVDLKLQPGTSMEAFEEALSSIELVREAMSLTGAFDVRIRVACKDTPHLGQIIEQLRAVPGIQETNSSMICRPLKIVGPSRKATNPSIRRRPEN